MTQNQQQKQKLSKKLPNFNVNAEEVKRKLESSLLELETELDNIEKAKKVDRETMQLEFRI
jgi:hypothetical protein